MSVYDVRRQRQSRLRSNTAAPSSATGPPGGGPHHREPDPRGLHPDAPGRGLPGQRLEPGHGDPVLGGDRPGRRHVPAGVTREEEPPERRVARVPGPRPPDHGLVLGPGQGDVGQPEVLAPLLDETLVLVAGEVRPRQADVDAQGVPGVRVVEEHRVGVAGDVARLPEEGQVDDRELEPLAPVDGQDLDGLGVGLEPAAALLVARVLGRLGDPPAQPAGQGRRPELLGRRRRVEELADVAQVGQPALPVGPGQDPGSGSRSVRVIASVSEATPSTRRIRAQSWRRRWTRSQASSSAPATASAPHPRKQVRAAARAGSASSDARSPRAGVASPGPARSRTRSRPR